MTQRPQSPGLTPISDDIERMVADCPPEIRYAWAVQKQWCRDVERTVEALSKHKTEVPA